MIIQWIFWFVIPFFMPETLMIAVFSVLIGALGILVWWAFFSRALSSLIQPSISSALVLTCVFFSASSVSNSICNASCAVLDPVV